MTFALTAAGLTVDTYDELNAKLVASYQAIYGADIDVSANSPDGQRIGEEVKARMDAQALVLSIYNAMDPDLADGESFNKLLKFSGLTLRPGTRSQVDVTVTTDRALTLPVGYTVDDTLKQSWIIGAEQVLPVGATVVTLYAEEFGNVQADPATVTTPATIVLGVVSVTNPAAAVAGVDEETVPEARIRRRLSVANPSRSTVGRLYAALGNLLGVTDLRVYENDQETTDPVLALGPHSIWVVIEGGDVEAIAETMATDKTAGTGMKGSVSQDYVETRTRPDLSTFDVTHTMLFDRPTSVPLFVTANAASTDGNPVDTATIEAAIAAKAYYIAEDAVGTHLYPVAYSAGSNFVLTGLQISDDDVTYTDGEIASAPDGKFTIPLANVTVTAI